MSVNVTLLKGEVEQIAMMKPKGQTEHDEGMLEYLEDIIGCGRLNEPIKVLCRRVEILNENRGEKVNEFPVDIYCQWKCLVYGSAVFIELNTYILQFMQKCLGFFLLFYWALYFYTSLWVRYFTWYLCSKLTLCMKYVLTLQIL